MADNRRDEPAGKAHRTNRRTFIRGVGITAAVAAVGTASTGAAFGADTTVDLGEEGLRNGDLIDPYLDRHFADGTEVRIPAGEYDYTGEGLGGDRADCALVGSPDGVTFNRPEDPEVEVRPSIMATAGTVRIENITIRGKRGEAQSRWRVGAEEGATMEVFNVNVPDGTIDGSDSTGLYAGSDHAGTLHCRACYFENMGNVAMYVSDAYTGGDGKVLVEDCVFRNINSSMVRFAPSDSVVRGCYFEGTEEPPADHTGGTTLRGIKVDDAGTSALIEDCDFYFTRGSNPIRLHYRGEGGSGTVRNVRIYNDGDSDAVQQDWETEGNWAGENIHLTGSGNLDVPAHFETVTGGDAEAPTTDYSVWTPVDDEPGSESATSGGNGTPKAAVPADGETLSVDDGITTRTLTARASDSTAGPASLPNRLEIDGTGDAEENAHYDFAVSGELSLDEGRTVVGSGETLWLTGDMSSGSVSGHVRNGVDAFFYSGTLDRLEIDGDADINVFHG
ncbi:hypothetical protein NDI56_03630 [Haloarcula sp. S1CR25-12]|uniref:Right-handed parallel beta-helix repeat-containing protein n=1 Tax=Haloarcula saliterrae TaxID=2950534 RepID=A0ABU2F9V4_9EURY|nr:hypothetical protein [Haloarcula sp. S1CR25-12]MDS0258500.1 hypothetical protein [Haloarcula sp. S1CR25-12]